MRQAAVLLVLLALLPGVARAEGPGGKPSFTWPSPKGWKTETIPFPLDFAPEVRHTGVEELRFSPGFGDPAAPDNWTYALAWVLEDKASFTTETLERELTAYFKGLSMAVGGKKFSFDPSHFSAHIRPRPTVGASEARELFGTVETYDCFRTGKPITLHVVARTVACEPGRPGALLVAISRAEEGEAKEKGSPIWPGLRRLLDDFHCGR
jgi:hypothetical protein